MKTTLFALKSALIAFLLIGIMPVITATAQDPAKAGTVLYYRTSCVGTPQSNFHIYHRLAGGDLTIEAGDHFIYEYTLSPDNPDATGGLDIDFHGGGNFRDQKINDSQGRDCHPHSAIPDAQKGWVTRDFDMTSLAGQKIASVSIVQEGDKAGNYEMFLRRAVIERDGKAVAVFYDGTWDRQGHPMNMSSGYSHACSLFPLPSGLDPRTAPPEELASVLMTNAEFEEDCKSYYEIKRDVDFALHMATAAGLKVDASIAAFMEKPLDEKIFETQDMAALKAYLDQANTLLSSIKLDKAYTGFYVAHSHMDFSWLWRWEEITDDVAPSTYRACISFMEKYPDFGFAQSSGALYEAVEKYPDIMADIRKYVAEGRWELVGGRWSEGDLNMTSPEAAVRQLLIGQQYFNDTFGKMSTVAWEPDTFGHAAYMPQLLNQAGMKYYYHMREAGRTDRTPVYWWEGLDGSRMLSYDEAAVGQAYMGPTDNVYDDIRKMKDSTGMNTALTIYGVGNHGGAPSREMIDQGHEIAAKPYMPALKFSTAEDFFKTLEADNDTSTLQVFKGELNPLFTGCYTSCNNLKQMIHFSERLAQQAEILSLITDQLADAGYPLASFDKWWQDILWGHHHDTLCGSSIREANAFNMEFFTTITEDIQRLINDRLDLLAERISPARQDKAFLLANTLAWKRGGLIELDNPEGITSLVDAKGLAIPSQVSGGKLLAQVESLPATGYATFYEGGKTAKKPKDAVTVSADGTSMKSDRFEIQIDPRTGRIVHLIDRKLDRDWVRPGASIGSLQVNHEYPVFMSAWDTGQILKSTELVTPESIVVTEAGPLRGRVTVTYRYKASTIEQSTILDSGSDQVQFETRADWHQVGTHKWMDIDGKERSANVIYADQNDEWRRKAVEEGTLSPEAVEEGIPALDVCFRLNMDYGKPVYGIPFGDVTRDQNAYGPDEDFMKEIWNSPEPHLPGTAEVNGMVIDQSILLDWVAVGDGSAGAAVNAKEMHGSQVYADQIKIVLLRSSIGPDYQPEDGLHVYQYAFRPYEGVLDRGRIARVSAEFQYAPLSRALPQATTVAASLPAAWSMLELDQPNLIVTGIKKAQRSANLIVRAFNCDPQADAKGQIVLNKAASIMPVDILERPQAAKADSAATGHKVDLKPYQIQSWAIMAN